MRERWWWIGGGSVAVIGVGAGAYWLGRKQGQAQTTTRTVTETIQGVPVTRTIPSTVPITEAAVTVTRTIPITQAPVTVTRTINGTPVTVTRTVPITEPPVTITNTVDITKTVPVTQTVVVTRTIPITQTVPVTQPARTITRTVVDTVGSGIVRDVTIVSIAQTNQGPTSTLIKWSAALGYSSYKVYLVNLGKGYTVYNQALGNTTYKPLTYGSPTVTTNYTTATITGLLPEVFYSVVIVACNGNTCGPIEAVYYFVPVLPTARQIVGRYVQPAPVTLSNGMAVVV